jgi:hypothetical protein
MLAVEYLVLCFETELNLRLKILNLDNFFLDNFVAQLSSNHIVICICNQEK